MKNHVFDMHALKFEKWTKVNTNENKYTQVHGIINTSSVVYIILFEQKKKQQYCMVFEEFSLFD